MGIHADYIANTVNCDVSTPINAPCQAAIRYANTRIAQGGDPDPIVFAAKNTVQTKPTMSGTVTDGTYTITLKMRDVDGKLNGDIVTAALAHDATAAAAITAIDTAVNGHANEPAGWNDGDVVISGGDPLDVGAFGITYEGSVGNINHDIPVFIGTGLTGGGIGAAVTESVTGQPVRFGLDLLVGSGVVVEDQFRGLGVACNRDSYTKGGVDAAENRPSRSVVETWVRELMAANAEDDSVKHSIRTALGFPVGTFPNPFPVS